MPLFAKAQTSDACKLLKSNPEWVVGLDEASMQWNISRGAILAIIDQESRFRATASNGVNYGYAQSNPQTWNWFKKSAGMPDASRTDFNDSAHFIGWHFNTMGTRLKIDLDDVARQYMAYKMGEGGYRRSGAAPSALARNIAARADKFNTQLSECVLD